MERGGTGDRQESATNLLGFKVYHSASFFVQSNTNLVIASVKVLHSKERSAFKLGDCTIGCRALILSSDKVNNVLL